MKPDAAKDARVYTLDTSVAAFDENRDWVPCFPDEEMVAIHLEAIDGREKAKFALDGIGLEGRDLGVLTLGQAWHGYERALKYVSLQTDVAKQTPDELGNCYSLIVGHIYG